MTAVRKIDVGMSVHDRIIAEPIEFFAKEILQLKRLKEDPPTVNWGLSDFQVEIVESLFDVARLKLGMPTKFNHTGKPWITVRSGHGPGKTFSAALVAHCFNAAFPGRIMVTAPKLKQVTDRIFPEFRKLHMRAQPWYREFVTVEATRVTWAGDRDWCMIADSATAPENIAGSHHMYQLVIVEEATGVDEKLFPVIEQALTTGKIQVMLMIANPTKRQGTFADSHLKEKLHKYYYRIHVNPENVPRVSRSSLERLAAKYGKDSPVYKVRGQGEFATEDERQLISLQWIVDARNRPTDSDGSLPKLRVAVDVADGGAAVSSVVAARHYATRITMLKRKRYSFESTTGLEKLANAAEAIFVEYGGRKESSDDFVVDANGVGAGVAGELIKRGYNVVTYKGGSESSNTKLWKNKRTQSYLNFRNMMRDGLVAFEEDFIEEGSVNEEGISEWDDYEAQICAVRTVDNNERLEEIETKKALVLRVGMTLDDADATAMQFTGAEPSIIPNPEGAPMEDDMQVVESTILEGLM